MLVFKQYMKKTQFKQHNIFRAVVNIKITDELIKCLFIFKQYNNQYNFISKTNH